MGKVEKIQQIDTLDEVKPNRNVGLNRTGVEQTGSGEDFFLKKSTYIRHHSND